MMRLDQRIPGVPLRGQDRADLKTPEQVRRGRQDWQGFDHACLL